MDLFATDIPYEWNPVWSFGFFRLAYIFRACPRCSIHQCVSPSHCWVRFHCVDALHFIGSFPSWWTFGLFLFFVYNESCCCSHLCVSFHGFKLFYLLLGEYLGMEFLGHVVTFCLFTCCHNPTCSVFCQQKGSISLHPPQHLLWSLSLSLCLCLSFFFGHATQHAESSQTRDQTCADCSGSVVS